MFEGIVSKILVKVLGDYIEDIDSQNLRLGLLAGDVQLKQLKMKSTALDAFDLPITVVWGYVGTIKASIPWKSLGTSPVTLDISDIYIVVQPRKCVAYDPEIEKERLEKSRIARLHNYEFHRMAHSLSTSPSHAVEDEMALTLKHRSERLLRLIQSLRLEKQFLQTKQHRKQRQRPL